MAEDQYHLTITQLGYDPVSKPPQFHKYNKDFFSEISQMMELQQNGGKSSNKKMSKLYDRVSYKLLKKNDDPMTPDETNQVSFLAINHELKGNSNYIDLQKVKSVSKYLYKNCGCPCVS